MYGLEVRRHDIRRMAFSEHPRSDAHSLRTRESRELLLHGSVEERVHGAKICQGACDAASRQRAAYKKDMHQRFAARQIGPWICCSQQTHRVEHSQNKLIILDRLRAGTFAQLPDQIRGQTVQTESNMAKVRTDALTSAYINARKGRCGIGQAYCRERDQTLEATDFCCLETLIDTNTEKYAVNLSTLVFFLICLTPVRQSGLLRPPWRLCLLRRVSANQFQRHMAFRRLGRH
jgi:hypothetical protein